MKDRNEANNDDNNSLSDWDKFCIGFKNKMNFIIEKIKKCCGDSDEVRYQPIQQEVDDEKQDDNIIYLGQFHPEYDPYGTTTTSNSSDSHTIPKQLKLRWQSLERDIKREERSRQKRMQKEKMLFQHAENENISHDDEDNKIWSTIDYNVDNNYDTDISNISNDSHSSNESNCSSKSDNTPKTSVTISPSTKSSSNQNTSNIRNGAEAAFQQDNNKNCYYFPCFN